MKTNKEMIEEAVANIHKGELLITEERKDYNTQILTTLLTKHEEAVVDYIFDKMQKEYQEIEKKLRDDFEKRQKQEDNKNYVFIGHNGKRLGNSNVYRDIAEF